jgi:hypothetical protein
MNKMKGIMNLPQKIEVKKTPVNVEETDKAVEKIHESTKKVAPNEVAVATPPRFDSAISPSPEPTPQDSDSAPKVTKKEIAPAPEKEKLVRITIDLPNSLYKSVKIKAVNSDKTLRDYVIGVLRKEA